MAAGGLAGAALAALGLGGLWACSSAFCAVLVGKLLVAPRLALVMVGLLAELASPARDRICLLAMVTRVAARPLALGLLLGGVSAVSQESHDQNRDDDDDDDNSAHEGACSRAAAPRNSPP